MITELCSGSGIDVITPDVEFFTDMINNGVPFSFVKQNHGLFELMLKRIDLDSTIAQNNHKELLIDNCIHRILESGAVDAKKVIRDNLRLDVSAYFEMLENSDKLPTNLFLGISDSGAGVSMGSGYNVNSAHKTKIYDIIRLFKLYLPETPKLYRGTIWKDYYRDGKVLPFLESLSNRKVLYVAPKNASILNTAIKSKEFEHLVVDGKASSNDYDRICDRINKLSNTIVLFTSGQVQNRVIKNLHGTTTNTMIDVGQSVLPYATYGYDARWLTL